MSQADPELSRSFFLSVELTGMHPGSRFFFAFQCGFWRRCIAGLPCMVFLLGTAGLKAELPVDSHGAQVADIKSRCSVRAMAGVGLQRCPGLWAELGILVLLKAMGDRTLHSQTFNLTPSMVTPFWLPAPLGSLQLPTDRSTPCHFPATPPQGSGNSSFGRLGLCADLCLAQGRQLGLWSAHPRGGSHCECAACWVPSHEPRIKCPYEEDN